MKCIIIIFQYFRYFFVCLLNFVFYKFVHVFLFFNLCSSAVSVLLITGFWGWGRLVKRGAIYPRTVSKSTHVRKLGWKFFLFGSFGCGFWILGFWDFGSRHTMEIWSGLFRVFIPIGREFWEPLMEFTGRVSRVTQYQVTIAMQRIT